MAQRQGGRSRAGNAPGNGLNASYGSAVGASQIDISYSSQAPLQGGRGGRGGQGGGGGSQAIRVIPGGSGPEAFQYPMQDEEMRALVKPSKKTTGMEGKPYQPEDNSQEVAVVGPKKQRMRLFLGPSMQTMKTSSIADLPCGNCRNTVTTVPMFAQKGICTEWMYCLFPIAGWLYCCFCVWAGQYNCTANQNRVEHYCPNCGAFLMVATPEKKGKCARSCGCGWNRLFPKSMINNDVWLSEKFRQGNITTGAGDAMRAREFVQGGSGNKSTGGGQGGQPAQYGKKQAQGGGDQQDYDFYGGTPGGPPGQQQPGGGSPQGPPGRGSVGRGQRR